MTIQKSAYEVRLAHFEGPLDLLLHLVDQEKLALSEISLAAVAHQYQDYLKQLESLNIEIESSYITVFAQLLELKSKLLLPPEPSELENFFEDFAPADGGFEGEEEPEDLLEQLVAYRALKEGADWLLVQESRSLCQYPRPAHHNEPENLELDVSLDALCAAWVRMDRRYQAPRRPVELRRIVLSVPDRVKQLWDLLRRQPRSFFHQFLQGDWNKAFVIVTFLAVLELVRRSRVRAEQNGLDSDIEITPYQGSSHLAAPETQEEYR